MTIKKNGGVFGRNPKFRNVAVDTLTVGGALATFPATNFTAARTDAAQSFTGDQTLATGNLVIGTAGKGIDFSADPSAAGMTNELFDDYEEGTFTPTMTSASGTVTLNSSSGFYTKIGNIVSVRLSVTFNTDASVSTSTITIGGLPFACNSTFVEKANMSYSNTTSTDYGDGHQQVFNSATSINWFARTSDLSNRTSSNLMFVASYQV